LLEKDQGGWVMRRPAFQFYPADWRNNANLRRCSWAARGVWIEVIGLMHDSDHYGILRWNLKEISLAIGCPPQLVRELVDKGVLKGCDNGSCEALIYVPRSGRKDGPPVELIQQQQGPIWYSSRMVKDEYVRTVRGDGSRFNGGNSEAPIDSPTDSPKVPIGVPQSDGSTSTSTSTSKNKDLSGELQRQQKPEPSKSQDKPATTTATSRGTRLPADWKLPRSWGEWALAEKPGWTSARVIEVADKFRDYWIAKAGRDGSKADWLATWRNWVRNEGGGITQAAGQSRSERQAETLAGLTGGLVTSLPISTQRRGNDDGTAAIIAAAG
jgi:hypothetical protein